MRLDDGGRHPQHGLPSSEGRPVEGLQRRLLRLRRPVRDGALPGGSASALVVIQPDARLLGQAVHLDGAHSAEELVQLHDLDVQREVFHENLDLGVDPRVVGARLSEAAAAAPAPTSRRPAAAWRSPTSAPAAAEGHGSSLVACRML